MFIALNAHLERQFEFVQQRWINNPRFGDLGNEVDPVLGQGKQRAFSRPADPVGEHVGGAASGLPQLVTPLGGGYFFMPGLKALSFLALNGE